MKPKTENAAKGVGALHGVDTNRSLHKKDDSSTPARGASVLALLDGGHVVAVFASADALRAYLMGGA